MSDFIKDQIKAMSTEDLHCAQAKHQEVILNLESILVEITMELVRRHKESE